MEEMPIALLKKDHRKVDELIQGCKNTLDPKDRAEIVEKIVKELEIHMQVEEEYFYPLVSKVSEEGEKLSKHGKGEHDEMREVISELKDINQMDDQDDENFKRLEMLKTDHVREEEQQVFPFAEKNLEDELDLMLSTKMIALKEKLKFQK